MHNGLAIGPLEGMKMCSRPRTWPGVALWRHASIVGRIPEDAHLIDAVCRGVCCAAAGAPVSRTTARFVSRRRPGADPIVDCLKQKEGDSLSASSSHRNLGLDVYSSVAGTLPSKSLAMIRSK